MLIDLACWLLSVVLLCCSAVRRPTAARCGEGLYVNGIRPTGIYECLRVPGGNPLYDGAAGYPDRTIERPGWYHARIYCTNGTHPIVVLAYHDRDARVVGCAR